MYIQFVAAVRDRRYGFASHAGNYLAVVDQKRLRWWEFDKKEYENYGKKIRVEDDFKKYWKGFPKFSRLWGANPDIEVGIVVRSQAECDSGFETVAPYTRA